MRLLRATPDRCPECDGDDLHSASLGGEEAIDCGDCDWIATIASFQPKKGKPTGDPAGSKSRLRLGVGALSDSIYVGRLTADGGSFRQGKQDVTDDFLRTIIDRFAERTTTITIGTDSYDVTVRRVRP